MSQSYEKLKARLSDVQALYAIGGVLGWDQQTYMPEGGAEARATQMALISRLAHEQFTASEVGELLENAAAETADLPYDSDEASLIRYAQHEYAQATKLPKELVSELSRRSALAHGVWAEAREKNEYAKFQPELEKLLELAQQVTEHLGYESHPYDALLNQYERGLKGEQVKAIFDEHKPALVELISAISQQEGAVSDAILHQPFDVEKQKDFGIGIVKAFGYDFTRGRQDIAVHPFCTSFSRNDVRITTRFDPNWLNPALFGTMHEAGHAMYEQGVAASLEGTPLAGGTSLGVHESQSRMWENIVGRSRGFWSWALPQLQATFPDQLGNVDLDTFYKAINKVERSLIRVEADEATYNLHIMLRFELEMEMVGGKLTPAQLPQAWNDRFEAYFGITPPSDTLGVLQDVHWSSGLMGYFPTYALGNLLASQYYNKAVQDRPSIPDDIANGNFTTLRSWLNENIHQHGSKFTADELTRRVTGEGIQSRDYIAYLQTKFGDIYGL